MRVWRVIDFETTGWPPNASVVEVGYTDVIETAEGQFMLGPTRSQICRPDHTIGIEAMAVHHITPEMVASAPYHQDVLEAVEADVKKIQGFQGFVAHNAQFDQKFFNPLGSVWGCTLKAAQITWPQAPKHTNQVLRYYLQLDLDPERCEPAHRAGPDTYVTANLFIALLEMMVWEQIVKVTGEPTLLVTISFGKYKGKLWSELPHDYLRYLLNNTQDPNVRHTAQYYLKQASPALMRQGQ